MVMDPRRLSRHGKRARAWARLKRVKQWFKRRLTKLRHATPADSPSRDTQTPALPPGNDALEPTTVSPPPIQTVPASTCMTDAMPSSHRADDMTTDTIIRHASAPDLAKMACSISDIPETPPCQSSQAVSLKENAHSSPNQTNVEVVSTSLGNGTSSSTWTAVETITALPSHAPPPPKPESIQDIPKADTVPEELQVSVDEIRAELPSPDPPAPSRKAKVTEGLKAVGAFTKLLLTKIPGVIDTNPVKVVFELAKIGVELQQGKKDNTDELDRQLEATLLQFDMVKQVLADWGHDNSPETKGIESYKETLDVELKKLRSIADLGSAQQFLLQEEHKAELSDIFARIEGARTLLLSETTLQTQRKIEFLDRAYTNSLPGMLDVSSRAHYNYYFEGTESIGFNRTRCAEGTRVGIISDIESWALNTAPGSETVSWLSGHAGSGKSTIAYTIAERFDPEVSAIHSTSQVALGATFFCSRQFQDTRSVKAVVRTIAYRLALASKAFGAALKLYGKFETIHEAPSSQLQHLLVVPWRTSALARSITNEPTFVIVIDALDELEGNTGSVFLRELFSVINNGDLRGLKFFVTSRSDDSLVRLINTFDNKQAFRLQDVPIGQATIDILTYLKSSFAHLKDVENELTEVAKAANGLFVYAATVVRYVKNNDLGDEEQQDQLRAITAEGQSQSTNTLHEHMQELDLLYLNILRSSLSTKVPGYFQKRKMILHTLLFTEDRTSTAVVAELLRDAPDVNHGESGVMAGQVEDVLRRLHAVLYTRDNRVMWYHKSFVDFLSARDRSAEYSWDRSEHSRTLAEACLRIMNAGLRFNIAGIKSSYYVDADNAALPEAIKCNISEPLRYACRFWGNHVRNGGPLTPSILGAMQEFLQLRVLFWIEAMNLLRELRKALTILAEVGAWAEDASMKAALAEARDFARHFMSSRAHKSTPHLYLSALATFPRASKLCTTWRGHFHGIPKFVPRISEHRPIPLHVAVSPDGECIASIYNDGWLRVMDGLTGDIQESRKVDASHIEALVIREDYSIVSLQFTDRHPVVETWDPFRKFYVRWPIGEGEEVPLEGASYALSSDGSLIAGLWRTTGSLDLWDTRTGEYVGTLSGGSVSRPMVLRGLIRRPFKLNGLNGLLIPDRTPRPQFEYGKLSQLTDIDTVSSPLPDFLSRHSYGAAKFAFARNLATFALYKASTSVIHAWREPSQNIKSLDNLWDTKYTPLPLAISPCGAHVVFANRWSSIIMWTFGSELITSELGPNSSTRGVISIAATSSDIGRIVTTSRDGAIRVWDMSAEHRPRYLFEKEKASESPRLHLRRRGNGPLYSKNRARTLKYLADDGGLQDDLILSIPQAASARLDISNVKFGEGWEACYTGTT